MKYTDHSNNGTRNVKLQSWSSSANQWEDLIVKSVQPGGTKVIGTGCVNGIGDGCATINNIDWAPNTKLGRCEGDCDSDNDCKSILKCLERNGDVAGPPECSGSMISAMDYCYLPPVINPISNPCTDHYGYGNCGQCSGDCDSDSDCAGDLICFQRSGTYGVGNVPGCSWDPNYTDFDANNWDYCK